MLSPAMKMVLFPNILIIIRIKIKAFYCKKTCKNDFEFVRLTQINPFKLTLRGGKGIEEGLLRRVAGKDFFYQKVSKAWNH
jgi:hypothetical protein